MPADVSHERFVVYRFAELLHCPCVSSMLV